MATIANLTAVIEAKMGGFEGNMAKVATILDDIEQRVGNVEAANKKTGVSFGMLAKSALRIGAAVTGAVVGAMTAAGAAMAYAAGQAGESDRAMSVLTAALQRAGVSGADVAAEKFSKFAATLQFASRFSDEAAMEAAALGARLGIPIEMLERATQAAADMGAETGDISEAMRGLALAAAGNARTLRQYNIEVSDTALAAGGFGAVLDAVNARFAGAAAAQVNNYQGNVANLGKAWGDLIETSGTVISQSEIVNAVLREMTQALFAATQYVSDNKEALQSLVVDGVNVLARSLQVIVRVIGFVGQGFAAFKAIANLALAGPVKAVAVFLRALSDLDAKIAGMARRVGMVSLAEGLEADAAAWEGTISGLEAMADSFMETAVDGVSAFEKIGTGTDKLVGQLDAVIKRINAVGGGLNKMKMPAGGGVPGSAVAGTGPDFLQDIPEPRKFGTPAEIRNLTFSGGDDLVAEIKGLLGTLGGELAGSVSGTAGAAVGGFAAAGPMGALGAVLASSEGFAKALDALNGVLEPVANTLGRVFEPLVPIFTELGAAIEPLLRAISPLLPLLVQLNPGFMLLAVSVRILAPVITALAKALDFVIQSIANGIIGFLKAIRGILKRMGIGTKFISDMINAVEEAVAPIDDMAEAADSAAAALYGIPEGFKYALRRFEAMTAEGLFGGGSIPLPSGSGGFGAINPSMQSNGLSGTSSAASSSGNTTVYEININGAGDPQAVAERVVEAIRRAPELAREMFRTNEQTGSSMKLQRGY